MTSNYERYKRIKRWAEVYRECYQSNDLKGERVAAKHLSKLTRNLAKHAGEKEGVE